MAKILFKKQLSPAVFQFRVEAPLIAQERKAGHVRGACPSGWHVPNTVEAEWLMRFTDDIYYRVNAINGNTNASKKAWVSYDVERLWPAKQLNGVWIKYQDYVWVWVPTDYISVVSRVFRKNSLFQHQI